MKLLNAIQNDNCKKMKGKETSITLNTGAIVNGIIRHVDSDNITIAEKNNWSNKVKLNRSEIKDILVSEHLYFSSEYKRDLRRKKIPLHQFRWTRGELVSLRDSYAFINYDGRIIEGKIVDTIHNENGNSSLLVESNGKTEEIFDYQIRDLEITGKTKGEHLSTQKFKALESELLMKKYEYTDVDFDLPNGELVDPDVLIDKYFQHKKHNLGKLDYYDDNEFNYSWTKMLLDSGVDDIHDSDIENARNVDKYYNNKRQLIDVMFESVCKVDWTQYSVPQRKTSVRALEHLYETIIM